MSETWSQDRTAINFLEKQVLALDWMWREQTLLDRGIDGQIEICESRKPLGELIAVQSRGRESTHRAADKTLSLQLEKRHLDYWFNYALPVIVVLHLPSEQRSYWVYIQEYLRTHPGACLGDSRTVTVPIPVENCLDITCKAKLRSLPQVHVGFIVTRKTEGASSLTLREELAAAAIEAGIDPERFIQAAIDWCRNVSTPFFRGVAMLVENSRLSEAESLLRDVVNSSAAQLAHHCGWLAGALIKREKYSEAATFVKQALALCESDPYVWNMSGIVLGAQNEYTQAVEAFRKATELRPEFAAPYYNWGKALQDQGKHAEALVPLREAAARFPKGHTYRLVGDSLRHLERYEQAEEAYRMAIGLDARDQDAWRGLGDVFGLQKRFAEAVDAYSRALNVEPTFRQALTNRGFARLYGGDSQGAQADFEAVLRLYPEEERARRGMKRIERTEQDGETG